MKRCIAVAALFSIISSTTVFANYTIEVCKVPIHRLIGTNIPGLKHVFLLGNDNGVKTSLNFGPVHLDAQAVALGDAVKANVTHEVYPDADCVAVLKTPYPLVFAAHWNIIKRHYAEAPIRANYQVYNVRGKNCSKVAEEACAAAALQFPFDNVNGQNHTADFLYGIGDMRENGVTEANFPNVIGHGLGALGGILKDTEGGEEFGEVLDNVGSVISQVAENEDCVLQ